MARAGVDGVKHYLSHAEGGSPKGVLAILFDEGDAAGLGHLDDGAVAVEHAVAGAHAVTERAGDLDLAKLAGSCPDHGLDGPFSPVGNGEPTNFGVRAHATNPLLEQLRDAKARGRALERVGRDENGRVSHWKTSFHKKSGHAAHAG